MLRFALLGITLLFTVSLAAQRPADLKKNGERAFASAHWEDALEQLVQYQQKKPGDLSVLTEIGICHFQLHHGQKALDFLSYVASKSAGKGSPELYYYLAKTQHGLTGFENAALTYKQYLRVADARHPLRANAIDNLQRCLSGAAMSPNEEIALVENLGDRVNSAGDEFAPLPSVNHLDRLYYAAARPGCTGGKRNEQGYEDPKNGKWCADMFYASRRPSGWEKGDPLSGLINSPRHEIALDFGKNGEILYFFRGFTLYSGDILADTAEVKDEYALEPPGFNGPVRGENGDVALFFFNDSTLLFASRQEGGYGGLDLYISRLQDSAWTRPRNLGPSINSAYDETTPFLAPDGRTLYFSSNRTESMGGLDIFMAHFNDKENAWQGPVNMGPPLNSPGDDAFFRLSTDGRGGWFASDRLDSYGQRDLYGVYFKSEQIEQITAANPAVFADVQARAAASANALPTEISLPALYYVNDKDLTGPDNTLAISNAVEAAQLAPNGKVLVTVHTDITGPSKFDLFYGIQRAQMVGTALVSRGISPNRIQLQSAGPAYPAARTVVGTEDYPAGNLMNKRVEIRMASPNGRLPLDIKLSRRETPAAAIAAGAAQYDQQCSGLAFRVEAVAARQILTTDAMAMFDDVLIESHPNEGVYHYMAGFFRKFDQAQTLKKSLQNEGFPDASVAAYVDGLRLEKAEAIGLVKKYPELAQFITN